MNAPQPQLVRYNDWRQIAAPALAEFTPESPVSVIVPHFAQPEELARTLAALEGQTYPQELFEVVVVDDGSPTPLARPRKTPLNLKVVCQEDQGFGLARARNTGAAAAAHDVLLFLDADMLPEADWLAAHARWHHAVPDAVTLGLRAHVSVDDVDAKTIRDRPGTLKELFAGRKVDSVERRWVVSHLIRTDDLRSRADDLFRVVMGGNFGIRRGFYELLGGFDESFTQWGGEDTEFGYRAWTRGGLLVPVQGAFAWHQGLREENQAEKDQKDRSQKLQLAKLAHLIANPGFRTGLTGRTFKVPQYVVTMEGGGLPAERLLEAVERVLSDPIHDMVVRLELPRDHRSRTNQAEPLVPADRAGQAGYAEPADTEGRTDLANRVGDADPEGWKWLERQLEPDPRVRVAPSRPALEEFPASPFHVTLPAGRPLHADVVHRLRAKLGTAVIGRSVFPDGSQASIGRAWALHRAVRTPWEASEFGEVVTIPHEKLQPPGTPRGTKGTRIANVTIPSPPGKSRNRSAKPATRTALTNLRTRLRQVDGPATAWRFVRRFAGAVLRRAFGFLRTAPPRAAGGRAEPGALAATPTPSMPAEAPTATAWAVPASPRQAEYPLGVEIAALGEHSRALFAASRRVAWTTASEHIDLVVADTADEAEGVAAPVVVLAEAPPMLSTPAFDPQTNNPIGWRRDFGCNDGNLMVGALGPPNRLPPGCRADRVLRRDEQTVLRRIHHLEDVAAFHADTLTRAGELARLAATGVVVHLADRDQRLAPYLGEELFKLMTRDMRALDAAGREALSVRMRRTALREHSLASRARQVAERVLADPPLLPLVSILLVTRRPQLLEAALTMVRQQTWPRLEVVLGLHGEGFGELASGATRQQPPVTVLKLDASLSLGSALNAAAQAACGTLLTKMDDDDLYSPDHIWDLVLAHQYSQAPLVGKGAEFVYLAASDRTLRRFSTGGERLLDRNIAGSAMLIERSMLDRVGGWKRLQLSEDQALVQAVLQAGAPVYRTHPYGYLPVRHGRGHTWEADDSYFVAQAEVDEAGWRPDMAGIRNAGPPDWVGRHGGAP